MADDFDSDTGVGFKRRISDISDTELEPRTFEEPHSAPLSPHQQSPAIGSDCDLESFNNGLQKKAKCYSHQDNQETVEEDKLDCGYDVAMKLNEGKIDADENDSGFCGNEESGEVSKNVVNSAVEDCNKGLADSCTSFDENVSESSFENKINHFLVESGLESISDSRSHVVKFTDENLGVIEGKGKHKMAYNDSRNQRACVRDVRYALKIQVIDDTALIGSVSASASRVVANHNVNKKNKKNQKTDFGNEKKSRRRGKALKNCSGTNGNGNGNGNGKVFVTQMVEVDPQKGCEKKGDVNVEEQKKKWAYSRKEMEELRFVNVEEQKKKWVEIHCGFGPAVRKEYDGLIDANHQKHIRVNFDPRPLLRKKDAGPPILSDEYFENMDNETQSMNSLDPACSPSDSVLDGDAVVQEEFSEDDDSDEEYSSIQRPAFLVTGKPDFDSGPPLDGLEYLRRVRWEAEHIPKVKVAKVERSKLNKEQTIYMPKIPDIAKCPDHLLPLKQWEDAFLAVFSELRLALSRYEGSCAKVSVEPQSLPAVHEQECPNLLLDTIVLEKFENLTTDEVDSSQSVDSSIQSSTVNEMDDSLSLSSPKSFLGDCGPTLSTILGMDSVARVSMLRKRISSVETMSFLSRNDCVWLFALCAAVDTPLNADTCASLRCLLRKCASLRAEKVEMDDDVVMLNILATVSGKYFGQSEN